MDAQGRIEVGERFIEQEGLRIADDRPAHGHTLALAAGEFAGITLHQLGESGRGRNLFRGLAGLGLGHATHA
ncbi:hypothetical protein D3C72_1645780 [compost metagenome]